MKRLLILFGLLFFAVLGFSQQNSSPKIVGGFPSADNDTLYQIQVGAFRLPQNIDRALGKLLGVSLNPAYEQYTDLFRVMVKGVSYRELPLVLDKMKASGFAEIIIRPEAATDDTAFDDASSDVQFSDSAMVFSYMGNEE